MGRANKGGKAATHKRLLAALVVAVVVVAAGVGAGLAASGAFAPANNSAETQAASPLMPEPSDKATDTPSKPAVSPDDQAIADMVGSMTLREKVCQMLIVTPESITGAGLVTDADAALQGALEEYPVGGLILFQANIVDEGQITSFNAAAQAFAPTPLFISVDEEGGRVARVADALGVYSLEPMLSYQDDGDQVAFDNAKTIADVLGRYGFNTDFAPDSDVWSNPDNTVIGDRAYSTDFGVAATLVAAAVRGFHAGNIVCALKHFPGHGDTSEDSHDTAAIVYKSLTDLQGSEFKPFEAGIGAGADMVMVGHIIVPDIDSLPATLSTAVVTGVLRGDLGYGGVVITDSLAMGGIA
ncbi:MAG: hypothetical protein FWD72_04985, partial [Eggerthellaceae bacterium]|nr:hypothetical protein [Eggerthellaceae bacterium]